jgi:5,6-dimethylbenzimidazole synthase
LAVGSARTGLPHLDSADALGICGAVQNFWLAARAEGLGVSWFDVRRPDLLRPILGIPSSMLPIALLCVGYSSGSAEPRAEKPQDRVDLTDLVYVDRWGARADAEPFFRHLDDQGLLS